MADITVIICTQNRADSLRLTLQCLAETDRVGLDVEVRVVDNASTDHTRQVVTDFNHANGAESAAKLPIEYLFEPTLGNYGKSHALNRGLASNGIGRLVAVLDDDMSVEPHWCQGVVGLSARWPRATFFTGRTRVVWPAGPTPRWATHPRIQSWIFSVQDAPTTDSPVQKGQWFLGGHFWFRSHVRESGHRFEDIWATEPFFMLQLAAEGAQGVRGPDAIAGHRIQRQLLDPDVAIRRARRVGETFAGVRLDPRFGLRHSQLSSHYPRVARMYVYCERLRWSLLTRVRAKAGPDSFEFGDRLVAIEREEYFRAVTQILKSRRRGPSTRQGPWPATVAPT